MFQTPTHLSCLRCYTPTHVMPEIRNSFIGQEHIFEQSKWPPADLQAQDGENVFAIVFVSFVRS